MTFSDDHSQATGTEQAHDLGLADDASYYAIFECAGVGVANVGLDGKFINVNARLCELLGYRRTELIGASFQDLTHPDDIDGNLSLFNRLLIGEISSYRMAKRYLRSSGEILWAELTVTIQRDEAGRPLNLISIVSDIGDQKRNEERLNFLIDELSHRSKNFLTVLQSAMRHIGRNATSVSEFQHSLEERIAHMAAAQNLMVSEPRSEVGLDELVASQLATFVTSDDARIELKGGPLALHGSAARMIGLCLYELATNSCKYGSLSSSWGRVIIEWSVAGDPADHLILRWIERDGPPVIAPTRFGFGRNVIERMIVVSLNGKVDLQFLPGGLEWTLAAPASVLAH